MQATASRTESVYAARARASAADGEKPVENQVSAEEGICADCLKRALCTYRADQGPTWICQEYV